MTSSNSSPPPWPTEIRLNVKKDALAITFADGTSGALPAEFLRVFSPSAEVQGHAPSQSVTVAGKRAVQIVRIEPTGNYAIRLVFSDGHATGIFTWETLHAYVRNAQAMWKEYLSKLSDKKLSRDG